MTEEEFEEVGYEPRSLKEVLTEMKDTSEIIVDLAYSALIFNSKEMAEKVYELERKMDTLNYRARLTAMVATRTKKDAESLSGILQVASAAEEISNAAGDIASLLKEKIEDRPLMPFVLAEAEEKINTLRLEPSSSMVGKTIGDLSIETETGMRIIALRRRKRWHYDPQKETVLRANDVFIVRGTEDGFRRLSAFARGKKPWPGVKK